MDYLPLFFDLKGKPCLLIGGGTIATRKARLLHKAGARINVVALEIQQELEVLALGSGGTVIEREYQSDDILAQTLVISATDNALINERVAADCKAINLPVNVVDNPALCSVIMPAIVDRSPLIIGITSGGEAPVLARRVRNQLESTIPANYGNLGALASQFRAQVKSVLPSEDARRRFWEDVLNGDIAEQVINGNSAAAVIAIQDKLNGIKLDTNVPSNKTPVGEVYLVGAGPGDPDLLTFKALRLMQRAEVVLYDRLVSPPILEMVRRDAERIYVGKKRADHAVPQQQINQMLVDYALQGKRVVRLKGGDPFIFGRGGEEIDLLAAHNIPFQVVPGITAASGCACYTGIPLTHRDYSQSVRFITGHLKQGHINYPWSEFADEHQTLVFYMGLEGLPVICEKLIEHGKSPETPVALIEKGTLPDQRIHISNLRDMTESIRGKEIHAPTLLIIGNVVKLHSSLKWYKK
ncbi:MAG: uroporphyrin-III C-methyltransferase/precorrin-2 dehydrogenase/sirohydrochlorin ferrochelatase [Lentisphaeria bacterium]|jgi:uroporphyrin-III C-methyltransferase/precorrin-2 dehydrogenase/sirohydrochlorin ferrochelatase